ncbi:MAG: hypothetical protein U0996_00865 [Planctomycetaceae bacterium]
MSDDQNMESPGGKMMLFLTLADMSPLPMLFAGGVFLLVICGMFVSVAVLLLGVIRGKRRRSKRPEDQL